MALEPASRNALLRIARSSIAAGLDRSTPVPEAERQDPVLWEKRASFVTLHRLGSLRGCIGSLEPVRPLHADVRHNAHSAAFHDPRFVPLAAAELTDLVIEISVLSAPRPLHPADRAGLLRSLRPGLDGLILEEGMRRATFLPSVWESLPDVNEFLSQLLRKAGLPPDHWSATLQCFVYSAESFGEPAA